jgi:hypothetical protein
MGYPAVFVVVGDAGARCHASRSGAAAIERFVIPGPEYALTTIAGLPRAADPVGALGWEGGVLVDVPARELLWYGDEGSLATLAYQRACLAVLAHSWAGWTVRWATDGASELDRRLGGDGQVARREPADHGSVVAAEASDLAGAWWTLATVRPPDGPAEAWAVGSSEGHLALAGPELPALLRGTGPGVGLLDSPHPPNVGVHVDVGARSVGWWTVPPERGVLAELPPRWPGWSVSLWADPPWADGYDRQLTACRGAVAAPAPDLRSALDDLEQTLARLDAPSTPGIFEAARGDLGG